MPEILRVDIPREIVESSKILRGLHRSGKHDILVRHDLICDAILLADGQEISCEKNYIDMITRIAVKYDLLNSDVKWLDVNSANTLLLIVMIFFMSWVYLTRQL